MPVIHLRKRTRIWNFINLRKSVEITNWKHVVSFCTTHWFTCVHWRETLFSLHIFLCCPPSTKLQNSSKVRSGKSCFFHVILLWPTIQTFLCCKYIHPSAHRWRSLHTIEIHQAFLKFITGCGSREAGYFIPLQFGFPTQILTLKSLGGGWKQSVEGGLSG